MNLQEIADVIKSVGVELAIVMPTPNEGRTKDNESGFKEKLRLSEKSHNKVKLFCGGEYISRPCKIRFSKSTLYGMTKDRLFDHHAGDPIDHAGDPRAPKRTV